MLTRRIAASVCTLCLVIPAAAGATIATPQDIIKAKGPAGATVATPQDTVKAKGPAGTTVATHPPPHVTRATYAAGASNRDGANGWRTAAIAEAALLAALALGSALLLHAARAPRMVT